MEIFGILSTLFLVLCGIPEAYFSLKNKTCRVPTLLLWFWWLGEIFGGIYTIYIQDFILTINYFCNIIIVGTIVFYWFKDRREING